MKLIKSLLLILITSALCNTSNLQAQIWPGDIDNNGKAEHVDLLYMGYAFGEVGAQRATISIDWLPQSNGVLWGITFPGTILDFSYADCNGDGVVDELDVDAITTNYAQIHQTFVPAPLLIGTPGVDPTVLVKRNSTDTLTQGNLEFFELHFGGGHFTNFYGVSFTVSFDSTYVDSVLQVFPATGWITNNNQDQVITASNVYFEPNPVNGLHGRIDIAYSRTSGVPIMGSGLMGLFAIVMEDNINGFAPGSVPLDMEVIDIRLVDEQLNFKPTVPSVSNFVILTNTNDSYFKENSSIHVFPNPASNSINIESDKNEITGIELYNLQGQLVEFEVYNYDALVKLEVSPSLNGSYILKIKTPDGMLIRRVMIIN